MTKELKVGDFVEAPKGCPNYFTEGKKYEVIELGFDIGFIIKNDTGKTLYCMPTECAHLNGKDWIIL